MRQIEDLVDLIDGRLGMYTMSRKFGEVCAFLDGFDACSEKQFMHQFRSWLSKRAMAAPELTWWGLVLAEVDEGFCVADARSFSDAENARAIIRLFSLLREFSESLPKD